MKQARLDSLADGIFSIVMTLLVLDFQVPILGSGATNAALLLALKDSIPFLVTFFLSFSLLFTYWRGHHSIVSVLAQNIDSKLTTMNAFFFILVGLVPFSTLLISRYAETQTAITIYGLHIILLGLLLYQMREYILSSETIRNVETTPVQLQHMTMRILVPVYTAAIAILLSFFVDTRVSILLFLFAIVFNLSGSSTTLFTKLFPNVFQK
ncbi:MAG: TMEM175 family protein [Patescibacteria group bacterium]